MTDHSPVYKNHPEQKGIVIFIHGFMGSPKQFYGLLDVVYNHGFSVAALLLPGHGGSAKAFSAGTYESWQSHVNDEIERFSHNCDDIYLVGHSMGGLLALNASIKYVDCVNGVYIIASPVINSKLSLYSVKIRLKQIFSRRNNPIKAVYLENSSVSISPGLIWGTIKPSQELKILIQTARDNLPAVTVPVTAAYSSADELISIKNAEILKNELTRADLTIVFLSNSLHAYYTKQDQLIMEESMIKMIQSQ